VSEPNTRNLRFTLELKQSSQTRMSTSGGEVLRLQKMRSPLGRICGSHGFKVTTWMEEVVLKRRERWFVWRLKVCTFVFGKKELKETVKEELEVQKGQPQVYSKGLGLSGLLRGGLKE
jgi:hypothetical protein